MSNSIVLLRKALFPTLPTIRMNIVVSSIVHGCYSGLLVVLELIRLEGYWGKWWHKDWSYWEYQAY